MKWCTVSSLTPLAIVKPKITKMIHEYSNKSEIKWSPWFKQDVPKRYLRILLYFKFISTVELNLVNKIANKKNKKKYFIFLLKDDYFVRHSVKVRIYQQSNRNILYQMFLDTPVSLSVTHICVIYNIVTFSCNVTL